MIYNLWLRKSLTQNLSPRTGLDIFVTFACDWECVLDIIKPYETWLGIVLSQSYSLESFLDIIGSEMYGCVVIAT